MTPLAPTLNDRKHAAIDRFLAAAAVDDRGDLLELRPHDEGEEGPLFGGLVLMMLASAASAKAPEGTRLHALHAQFLRPVFVGEPVEVETDVVKAGRAFTSHQLTMRQGAKPAVVALCSFTTDVDEPDTCVYDVAGLPHGAGHPDTLPFDPPEEDEHPDDWPWETRWLGPSEARPDGTYESTHRHWFRIPRPLPDDPALHLSLLAYATDWTGYGGRPLALDVDDHSGMISLDHAAWFHRPSRADEWHLMDVQCLVNAGGRSTLRSVIRDLDGAIVASMAQEMLVRPI